ncbi:MAG: pyridoxal phosphate-dependent aminotransferase [Candidatus Binatia bacterium]
MSDDATLLNPHVRGLTQSATLAINERSATLQRAGRHIYKFGLGQSPFPVPTEVVNTLKLYAHEKDYLPVRGLPALREAVADFHRRKDRVDAVADNVLVGPGSKELLFLLQLVFDGEIVVSSPSWVSYVPQARILGRHAHLIHTSFEDKWRILPERLAAICEQNGQRPTILVLNYPGNPEGVSYSAEELKEIADVARQFKLVLLSDEIYGQLHHRGEHVSVARYYPEGTIISSGLSKWCGAGGWRLGTFTFPPHLRWLLEAMAVVASETYTSVSAPIQYAAVRAFRGGITVERYLWHARRILAAVGQRCTELLSAAGVRLHAPTGAFYLFLDFTPLSASLGRRGITDGATLCARLLEETGVAILPGEVFHRPPEELTARLAYVNFEGATALAASETVPLDAPLPEGFIEQWCGEVLEGVGQICRWLHK